jgi:hypothetical protein
MSMNPAPFAVGLATLLFVAGCSAPGSIASVPPSPDSSPSAVPEVTASAPPLSDDYCGSATINIDYQPLTTATMAETGWDFIVVNVVGFGAAYFNTSDGKAPPGFPKDSTTDVMVYTPIDVAIDEAIGGVALSGGGRFLVEGGKVGCYTMFVTPTPQVEVGKSYVFITSVALDSTGKIELPLTKARFAWPIDSKGIVATVDGPMSIAQLRVKVLDARPAPSSPPEGK